MTSLLSYHFLHAIPSWDTKHENVHNTKGAFDSQKPTDAYMRQ